MGECVATPGRQVDVRLVDKRAILRVQSFTYQPRTRLELAGQAFSSAVGTVSAGAARVLCTAPGEWWIVSSTAAAHVRESLEPELAGPQLALIDLSAGFSVFEVTGPLAVPAFNRSCGLNFEAPQFPTDSCARTRFANIPAVVDCRAAGECYDLYVPRSYRAYLEGWLKDASQSLTN